LSSLRFGEFGTFSGTLSAVSVRGRLRGVAAVGLVAVRWSPGGVEDLVGGIPGAERARINR